MLCNTHIYKIQTSRISDDGRILFNIAFDYETKCINTVCTLRQNVGGLLVPAIVSPAPSDRAKAAVSFGRPKQNSAALYGSVQRQWVEFCKKRSSATLRRIIYVHIRNATKKLWLCLFFIFVLGLWWSVVQFWPVSCSKQNLSLQSSRRLALTVCSPRAALKGCISLGISQTKVCIRYINPQRWVQQKHMGNHVYTCV